MQSGYELLLPEGLLDYFDVVQVDTLEKVIILHLDEKVLSLEENQDNRFISKGFYPPTDIHDFTLTANGSKKIFQYSYKAKLERVCGFY